MQYPDHITHTSTIDLLAVLLGSRRTAESLLRKANGSLFNLLHQTPEASGNLLCSPETGAYATKHLSRLHAARELAARSIAEELTHGDVLSSPSAVRDFLIHRLAGRQQEIFVAILLDAQNRVICVEDLFFGSLTSTSVYPREVVKFALAHSAAGIIFAHNHPSGVAEPSRADELLTQTLKQALALIDTRVLDHMIVAGNRTLSFAESGLL